MKIRETIENHQSVVLSVLACLGLLTKFADIFTKSNFQKQKLFPPEKKRKIFHEKFIYLNNLHSFQYTKVSDSC